MKTDAKYPAYHPRHKNNNKNGGSRKKILLCWNIRLILLCSSKSVSRGRQHNTLKARLDFRRSLSLPRETLK